MTILVQDPALLEFAWVELLERNQSVTAEELAEVLYFPNDSICLIGHLSNLSQFCR